MTAETAVLPSHPPRSGTLPEPGTYRAGPDRCILEISAALGPFATLHDRLPVRANRLVIESAEKDSSLFVEAARRQRTISFASTGFTAAESCGLTIPGELSVSDSAGDEAIPLTLRTRIVGQGINRLLIIGTADFAYGQVRDLFSFWLPRLAPIGGLRLLLAADFR